VRWPSLHRGRPGHAYRVGQFLAHHGVTVLCGDDTGVMTAVAAGVRLINGVVIGIQPNDSWSVYTCSGLWASVVPGDGEGRYDVRQHGPREVEAAHRWWRHSGEPTLKGWGFVVTPDRQTVRPARP